MKIYNFNLILFKLSLFTMLYPMLQKTAHVGSSFIPVIIINMTILFSIFLLKPIYFNKEQDNSLIWPIKLYLLWNFVTIIRGVFIAENYWEWKNLVFSGFVMLMPLFVYVFSSKLFTQKILLFWTKYMIFAILLFIPIVNNPTFYGMSLTPIMIFLLLFPLLSIRLKILVLLLLFIGLSSSTGSRTYIIEYSLSFLLGISYYIGIFAKNIMFKIAHSILILLPLLLLILGLLGVFNIFKINNYIKGNYTAVSHETGKAQETSLKADTRTFLYVENINSAIKNKYILFGRTPANGYDSQYFGNYLKYTLHTGKMQRFSSEVGILNIFLWGGLISVFLYFLVFFYASYLAVYKSNSYFMKIIGLFVAFKWAYSFVGEFAVFDMMNTTLWLLISICYSTQFRKMNDFEVKEWVKHVFPVIKFH